MAVVTKSARVGPIGPPEMEPPLQVVLACTVCEDVFIPTDAALEGGRTGCPRCGGWTWLAELAVPNLMDPPYREET